MRIFESAIIIALVVAFVIFASPLKGETWVVLAKPGYGVIGTFELEKGGAVNIDIDTRDLCIKTFEVPPESVPSDFKQLIEARASQTVMDGRSVDVVTITIDKAVIKAGFEKQKYKYNLKQKIFELKAVIIKK